VKILVFGANGMIGRMVVRVFSEKKEWEVIGTVRREPPESLLSDRGKVRILDGIDAANFDVLAKLMSVVSPDLVVNCAGLTKHRLEAEEPLSAIPVNSLFPHRLAALCNLIDARLIHVSTDCVFSGSKGGYTEGDLPDAVDIYGRSKALGEVSSTNSITLRTSTIGHEFNTRFGLLEWFLSREVRCKGFTRAIFSGLPTVVFAQVMRDVVAPRRELSGLFHVASSPINKFELLRLIATVYGKKIEIEPDGDLILDRSLKADRFRAATGYVAPGWEELVETMYKSQ